MREILMEQLAEIEADRDLLKFKTYEDYLDSLVTVKYHCYLQSHVVFRTIAELGYRSAGETLSKEQFEKRLNAVLNYLNPPYKPYELASENLKSTDPVHTELAIRERSNRLGVLSTIIFLRRQTKAGFQISGYMDYSERLVKEDWRGFFKGTKKLSPKPTDLGYYHWRTGKICYNNTMNYKVLNDPIKGLLFQHKLDRQIISVDPIKPSGPNSSSKRIFTNMYDLVVIFDHIVRQKI